MMGRIEEIKKRHQDARPAPAPAAPAPERPRTVDPMEWITTEQAAAMLGVGRSRIAQLVKAKRLEFDRAGRRHKIFIRRASAESLNAERHGVAYAPPAEPAKAIAEPLAMKRAVVLLFCLMRDTTSAGAVAAAVEEARRRAGHDWWATPGLAKLEDQARALAQVLLGA